MNHVAYDILIPLGVAFFGGVLTWLTTRITRATTRIERKQEHISSAVTDGHDTTLAADVSEIRERQTEVIDSVRALRDDVHDVDTKVTALDGDVTGLRRTEAHHLAWHQRQAEDNELHERDRDPWEEPRRPRPPPEHPDSP